MGQFSLGNININVTFEQYYSNEQVDENLKSKITSILAAGLIPFQGLSAKAAPPKPSTKISKTVSQPPQKVKPLSTEEANKAENIVIATIVGEARSEGVPGMASILNVIQNRLKSVNAKFTRAKDVVLQPQQFSIWNGVKTPKQRARFVNRMRLTPEWVQATKLYKLAAKNKLQDLTGGATFYHAVDIEKKPYWVNEFEKTNTVKGHQFYKHTGTNVSPFLKEDIDTPNNGFLERPIGGPNLVNFSPNFKPPVGIYLQSDQIHTPTIQQMRLKALKAIRKKKTG